MSSRELRLRSQKMQCSVPCLLCRNFTNPFSILDKDHLYSLASGVPVSIEVEIDVLRAEALGKEAKEAFIQDCFVNGSPETQFFEPISKQKLKTMEDLSKTVKLTTSQGKVLISSYISTISYSSLHYYWCVIFKHDV